MVFVVYEGDAYLSNSSLYLTAICDSRKKAINVICGYLVKKYDGKIKSENLTSNNENNTNYIVAKIPLKEFRLGVYF